MTTDLIIRPARQEDLAAMTGLLALLFELEEDFSVDTEKQRAGLEIFFRYPDGRYLLVAEQQLSSPMLK